MGYVCEVLTIADIYSLNKTLSLHFIRIHFRCKRFSRVSLLCLPLCIIILPKYLLFSMFIILYPIQTPRCNVLYRLRNHTLRSSVLFRITKIRFFYPLHIYKNESVVRVDNVMESQLNEYTWMTNEMFLSGGA